MGFTEDMLGDEFHIPEIKIKNTEEIPYLSNEGFVTLNIEAWDDAELLDRINVWINDVPIFGMKGLSLNTKVNPYLFDIF